MKSPIYLNEPIPADELERQSAAGAPDERTAALQFALRRVMAEKGVAAGVPVDGAAVEARMAESGLPRSAAFEELLVEGWLASLDAVDDDEAEAFRAARLAGATAPARVRLRHVLVTINDAVAENRRDAARARIDEAHGALAAGTPFGEVAARYSECPTALEGGDLGWRTERTLYPALAEAALAMAPGASAVVETELGYHLIEVTEKEEARPVTVAEGLAAARERLAAAKRKTALAAVKKTALERLSFDGAETEGAS